LQKFVILKRCSFMAQSSVQSSSLPPNLKKKVALGSKVSESLKKSLKDTRQKDFQDLEAAEEFKKASRWHKFLWQKSVNDFLGDLGKLPSDELKRETMSKIKFVEKDDTIATALGILMDNHILSVPVYHAETNMFIGFVDVLDIVAYMVNQIGRTLPRWEALKGEQSFLFHKVGHVIDSCERNTWCPIDRRAPLILLFDTLSRTDVHRVPIIDMEQSGPDWRVLAIVTQSQVIEWLYKTFKGKETQGESTSYFPTDAKDLKMKDFNTPIMLGKDFLVLAHEDFDLLYAFQLIKREEVSAIGVINDEGQLLGNVSASDVRLLTSTEQLIEMLTMKLSSFLEFKAKLQVSPNTPYSHSSVLSISPDDTLYTALEKLNTNRVHRLWIVKSHPQEGPEEKEGEEGQEETGEIDRELAKAQETKNKKRKQTEGVYPVGCLSVCDILNELAIWGTPRDRVLRRVRKDNVNYEEDEVEDEGYEEDDEEEETGDIVEEGM
jgi:CBS domain-containing protein